MSSFQEGHTIQTRTTSKRFQPGVKNNVCKLILSTIAIELSFCTSFLQWNSIQIYFACLMFYLGTVSHCFALEYFTFLHNLRVHFEASCTKDDIISSMRTAKTRTRLQVNEKALFSSKKSRYFLISPQKHMLWVLIRSASVRRC